MVNKRIAPQKRTAKRSKSQPVAIPFKFKDIRLVESKCFQAIEGSIPTRSQIHVNVSVMKEDNGKSFRARPTVEFKSWYDDKSKDDPAVIVEATYQLGYDFDAKSKNTPDNVEEVIGQLCLLHSWPFFREFIQSQMNRMGLPPVLLPLLVAPPAKE